MFNTVKKIAMVLVLAASVNLFGGIAMAQSMDAEATATPAAVETVAVQQEVKEAAKPVETPAAVESTAPAAPATEVASEPATEAVAEPTAEATSEPTIEPTVEPTAEPEQSAAAVSARIVLDGEAVIGRRVTLKAILNGDAEGAQLQWQFREAGGAWKNIAEQTRVSYEFELTAENVMYEYRVEIAIG